MPKINTKKTNPLLIIIAGPTAVGKTALSIQLASYFSCSIISADSRQFFKEMDIGTAKPTIAEMQGVSHYFIGTHSIHESYNVGKFEEEAIQLLNQLFKTNDKVIMVGGSGLYINAICNGLDPLPEADDQIRKELDELFAKNGIEALQSYLKKLDPVYYEQVDSYNPQRLSRAIEVCLLSGKPYSELRKSNIKKRSFNVIKIGLDMPRALLYDRINKRVDLMMEQGLQEEVLSLKEFKNLNALQTVGYKEFYDVLDELEKNINNPEHYSVILKRIVEQIKQNTRRFAKRQLTWFRRDEQIRWFKPDELQEIIAYINLK